MGNEREKKESERITMEWVEFPLRSELDCACDLYDQRHDFNKEWCTE